VGDPHKRTGALIERRREILRRKIISANCSERFSATTELLQTVQGIRDICYQSTSLSYKQTDITPEQTPVKLFFKAVDPGNTFSNFSVAFRQGGHRINDKAGEEAISACI